MVIPAKICKCGGHWLLTFAKIIKNGRNSIFSNFNIFSSFIMNSLYVKRTYNNLQDLMASLMWDVIGLDSL